VKTCGIYLEGIAGTRSKEASGEEEGGRGAPLHFLITNHKLYINYSVRGRGSRSSFQNLGGGGLGSYLERVVTVLLDVYTAMACSVP
jgi:hypothetical protein